MKREFLVHKCKELHEYLQEKSNSCTLYKYADKNSYKYEFEDRIYVLEQYKNSLSNLNKLILIAKEKVSIDKKIQKLQEITDDKRYQSKYLKLFGNPKNYDFDVSLVLKKCDAVGLSRLDLHFHIGMSCSKVFRVLLYRLNQIFILQYEAYRKNDIDTEYKDLEKTHTKLCSILKLAYEVFDEKIIKCIEKDFENLDSLLDYQETYERYVLNFQTFVHEESFYDTMLAQEAIYFFNKKEKVFKLAKSINKIK
ncbi:hypothetical protein [Sulfurospirillum arcachonense]|uniref:hypothetical protein n=1 Tax=Sulfurospirillum arcachonense TaxID=57666 RepID=UPI00046A013C|nr:hypothetical protein [Sulfurospirillum arcachonense]